MLIEERANENRGMTVVLSVTSNSGQQAHSCYSSITKESGAIYKSTRERVDSRN